MSFPARPALALALIATAFAAVGCAGEVIDKSKTEAQVQSNLETAFEEVREEDTKAGRALWESLEISPHDKITSVDCPSDQKIDPGTTFDCTVNFSNGKSATETLKIRNKDADLTPVGLESKSKKRGE